MKTILSALVLCISFGPLSGQFDDHAQITSQIKTMFESMRKGDNSLMHDLFEEGAMLESVFFNKDGQTVSRESSATSFIEAVGEPHDKVWDERIHNYDINIDGPLAIAWTPYSFYLGDEFSHCGVNVFTFVKTDGVWKIRQLRDTRKRAACKETN